ncbi:MAG: PAS domain S-box protein [Proteobacteria bacterium]|nr:PAS domain S-box protein [Pseudomonadota bacterium]MBU4294427.1 PAS domain S-box protein [Pseudomonadota bacterium]MCG2747609.1 PAS domain S-box protein [Desulfobulbaceae bacterium]
MTLLSPANILFAILLYVGLLFLLARWVEKKASTGVNLAHNPVVYSLSLAVYCTTWTYYGSVGVATTSGMLFLTISLGPTMALIFWWQVLRKLVRLKETYHITSIADFLGARYGKSETVAAIASLVVLIGTVPYIALQLKAVILTFVRITRHEPATLTFIENNLGMIIVCLMIFFTIVFGVRRLDATERHQGIVAAVAAESLVKLVAFLAAGVFVTFFVFNGFTDIFERVATTTLPEQSFFGTPTSIPFITVCSYLFLAMFAFMFLPRQFHVAVVENSNEKHIRTAMWLFPLYLILINLFIFPIAAGGLLIGLPLEHADTFVLDIPLHYNRHWLALLVFIGGLSAGTSMIMISSMTLATMISNHLLLPLLVWFPGLAFLRRQLLRVRWVSVALIIMAGYWFETIAGEHYSLFSMGIISFVAVLQFTPVMMGGIYWRRGNHVGALLGLCAGCLVWFYTLIVPLLARSGILPADILLNGPGGIGFLNPVQLFGITQLDPISHAVVWTMLFNIGFYVLGSFFYEAGEQEKKISAEFIDIFNPTLPVAGLAAAPAMTVHLPAKRRLLEDLLNEYFSPEKTNRIINSCLARKGTNGKEYISVIELADISNELEKNLAGSIGSSTAYKTFQQQKILNANETLQLQKSYGEILADLNLSPAELRQRIDFYKEREMLVTRHAEEQRETILELHQQISKRRQAERALTEQLHFLQELLDSIPSPIFYKDDKGAFIGCNTAYEEFYGINAEEFVGKTVFDIAPKEMADAYHQMDLALLQQPGKQEYESTLADTKGEVHEVIFYKATFRKIDGSVGGLVGVILDITARKRAENALAEQVRLLSLSSEIGLILTKGQTLQEILLQCTEAMVHFLDASFARIWTVNSQENILELRASAGEYNHLQGARSRLPITAENKIGFIALQKSPHLTNEVIGDPQVTDQAWAREQGLVSFAGHPLLIENRVIGVMAIFSRHPLTDITSKSLAAIADAIALGIERKNSEESLRRARDKAQSYLDTANVMLVHLDEQGKILLINRKGIEMLGYEEQELLGRHWGDFVMENGQRKHLQALYADAMAGTGQFPDYLENTIISKNGEQKMIAWRYTILHNRAGIATGMLCSGNDITEKYQAVAALHESRERLRAIIDTAASIILMLSPDFAILEFNPAAEKLFGRTREEVLGENYLELFIPQDLRPSVEQEMIKVIGGIPTSDFENDVFARHGERLTLLWNADRMVDAAGRTIGVLATAINITERKQTEIELENAHALLRSLIDSVPDLIFFKDHESTYLDCNKAFAEFAGKDITDIIGKTDYDFFSPELAGFFREKDRQMLASGETKRNEEWVDYPDGRHVLLDTLKTPYHTPDGTVLGLIGVSRDVTERKKAEDDKEKLEAQLRQAQKLEAIGTLAGGIAHDFNNILFAILGNADIGEIEISRGHFPKEELKEIKTAGIRARDLVKQILSFARKAKQERMPLCTIIIIKEVLKLLRSTLPTTIDIRQDLRDPEASVIADPTEIHQLFMNLCTNAGHAMMKNGGMLEVGQRIIDIDEDFAENNPNLQPGPHLLLTISDTGEGMTPETIEHIFEPFFTTKGKAEGTGMGLAVVHGIVTSLNGAIKVYSEIGHGTSFTIYLPLVGKDSNRDESGPEQDTSPPGKQEHILLVDDDKAITVMLTRMLTNLGYQVTCRTDSMEALAIFQAEPGKFDLIITDQTMPKMTGAELASEMLKLRPDLPIILCTGFSQTVSSEKAKHMGIREYLTKPVMKKELAVVVRRLLDKDGMTGGPADGKA